MMDSAFTEAGVKSASLSWFEDLSCAVVYGSDIAAGEPAAERDTYQEVVLTCRLRDAISSLNPNIPVEACEEAFRKIILPDLPSLIANNHAFHRMLVDGVGVEYRRADGSIAGDRVGFLDFENPDNNDWLVANQFTVVEGQHNRRPDVVVFINGLPLAVIELKNAADENGTSGPPLINS